MLLLLFCSFLPVVVPSGLNITVEDNDTFVFIPAISVNTTCPENTTLDASQNCTSDCTICIGETTCCLANENVERSGPVNVTVEYNTTVLVEPVVTAEVTCPENTTLDASQNCTSDCTICIGETTCCLADEDVDRANTPVQLTCPTGRSQVNNQLCPFPDTGANSAAGCPFGSTCYTGFGPAHQPGSGICCSNPTDTAVPKNTIDMNDLYCPDRSRPKGQCSKPAGQCGGQLGCVFVPPGQYGICCPFGPVPAPFAPAGGLEIKPQGINCPGNPPPPPVSNEFCSTTNNVCPLGANCFGGACCPVPGGAPSCPQGPPPFYQVCQVTSECTQGSQCSSGICCGGGGAGPQPPQCRSGWAPGRRCVSNFDCNASEDCEQITGHGSACCIRGAGK